MAFDDFWLNSVEIELDDMLTLRRAYLKLY